MNKKYIIDASRTDLDSYKDTLNRLDELTFSSVSFLLEDIESSCKELDDLKKFLFYGKGDDNKKTIKSKSLFNDNQARLLHSLIGIITEAGELCNQALNVLKEKNIYLVNILEEFGDIAWYQAIGVKAIKLEDINIDTDFLKKNIEKLKARYPVKFTEHHALNRDLKKERKILEG